MKKIGALFFLLLAIGCGLWSSEASSRSVGIVINDADYARTILPMTSSNLQNLLENLTSILQINYSDYVRYLAVEYPLDLVGDNTSPEIQGFQFTPLSNTTGRLVVYIDEFATTTLNYGEDSLNYTNIITNSLYLETQVFTLEALTLEETYYFQIKATDLSGNTTISPEQRFIFLIQKFLPFVTRD